MNLRNNIIAAGLIVLFNASIAFGYCPSQMVSYWKLDETSGTVFQDTSESNLPGSCSTCPAPTAGRIDSGQLFTNDTISIPANSAYDWSAGDSFSFEAWMRRSGSASGDEVLVGRSESGGELQVWVGLNSSGRAFARLRSTNGSGASADVTGVADLTDGAWHHIIFIRDGAASQNKLFVDGALVDTSATITYTSGFGSPTAPVEIGSLNGARFFNGTIDEIAIFKRVLSDTEIVQHYNDGTVGLQAGYCSPADDIRIMPLGDSITRGSQSTNINGYRWKLFNDLEDLASDGIQDYYVDFVGSLSDGAGFDTDHEGHGGQDAAYIRTNVTTYLSTNPADVILLHIGTNDLDDLYSGASTDVSGVVSQTTAEVDSLLDNIWTARPDASVILARIVLRQSSSSSDPNDYAHLLNESLEAMANTRIGNGDKLVVVDHESALNYPADMADAEHPNDGGYAKMADVWYTGLSRFLPPTNEMAPQVISEAVMVANVGVAYSYHVEAAGSPNPTYALTVNPSGMTVDGTSGVISWTPSSAGMENVSVRAANLLGNDVQSFQIEINTPPVAAGDNYSVDSGRTLNVSAPGVLDNDTDADSDPLAAQLIADVANGTLTLNNNGSFTYIHDGGPSTSDSFSYRADDGKGTSSAATVAITVTNLINDAPVITGQSDLTIAMAAPFEITLAHLTVSDPDNTYPADFTLAVANGADYSRSGNTITPASEFFGNLTVPVIVNDGTVDSATFNMTIGVNSKPRITGQADLSVPQDTPINITLDNLTISDSDNDPSDLTLTIYDGADYTLEGSQVTPAAGLTGRLSIPISVGDGVNESDVFNLSVTVNPKSSGGGGGGGGCFISAVGY